ncbi:exonuclease [Roseibium denhamense]|uniref:Exonuclease n=1 Tax=Roseibium denhamense TaxID=76305 RepID=A0ABY1PC77_9HYPH|nr:exonuclease domain-containing protein [Roseibium denhamense]MTI07470.1 exonuclease [Roseibium denhamense]SMP29952.1 Exonuclease [Roseibium denhamense]
MHGTIIFDCEYLTAEGAMSRMWCGPFDPDPQVAQIGAVKLSLEQSFDIIGTERIYIQASDRNGRAIKPDPYFTELTGITQKDLAAYGVSHAEALDRLSRFAAGSSLWSWGKDELTLLGTSCYIAGVPPSIPANRFGHAGRLLLKAGMPEEDVMKTTSGKLAGYFGLQVPDSKLHDALDDAMSIARTLQHFLRNGRLAPDDFVTRHD